MQARELWVIGGDTRQTILARELSAEGRRVHTFALGLVEGPGGNVTAEETLDGLGRADCVVLPLPVSRTPGLIFAPQTDRPVPVPEVLDAMRPGQLVLGGQMDEAVVTALRARGLRWRDYFAREELAVANAIPTAEGALQIAMEQLPVTLHGSRALVVGYGRIGRILASRLRGLGARVTATARREEQLAWAQADGCAALSLSKLGEKPEEWDVIFNTVPAPVLSGACLEALPPSALLIDLASEPGGVDREGARQRGMQVIWARSLPGKTAPATAARALRETIHHILQEVPV